MKYCILDPKTQGNNTGLFQVVPFKDWEDYKAGRQNRYPHSVSEHRDYLPALNEMRERNHMSDLNPTGSFLPAQMIAFD